MGPRRGWGLALSPGMGARGGELGGLVLGLRREKLFPDVGRGWVARRIIAVWG